MKQFHWNHIDQRGKLHKVGLLHGGKTGHVLIHVNGKITSIDFSVLETKQYSFFINEELIELNIIRHDDHFEYTMEINEDVKTPLNQRRNEERKKMDFQTLAFFGFMMAIVIGFSIWLVNADWYQNKNQGEYEHLAHIGEFAKAKLFVDDGQVYDYQFVARQEVIQGSARKGSYPIKNGDEYMVKYLRNNPEISEVHFDRPSENQVRKSMQECVRVCQNVDATKSEGLCNCIVESFYEIGGYNGLMTYINQEVNESDNTMFNREVYESLMGSEEFKVAMKGCK